jgi:hypothetical protein
MKKFSLKPGLVTGMLIMILSVLFNACRKNVVEKREIPTAYLPATPEDQITVQKIKKIESILEVIYGDPEVRKEVSAILKAKPYYEEAVLVSDLLYPERSKIYSLNRIKQLNVKTGVFASRFKEEFQRQYPVTDAVTAREAQDPDYYQVNGVTIYWPYSEDFDPRTSDDKFTLVAADRDADAGPGRKPVGGTPARPIYSDVNVDDDYAAVYPTHIVGVIDKWMILLDIDSVPPPPPPPPGPQIRRVYHGWSRLTRQLDALISFTGNGGGSEMKVCRISGYLQFADQQVTNFAGDQMFIYYSRADIRKKRWKRVMGMWDPDWKEANLQQVYAAYEEDTKGTKNFKGSLSTTVRLPDSLGTATGTIGFDINVVTQDDLVKQTMMDRYSYFRDALNDQGWGFQPDPNDFLPPNVDWPRYDVGTIWGFTWPYKIY